MQRLFVALDLPDDIRAALAAIEFDRTTWRPIPEEALHVTLAFLGDRPESDVPLIAPLVEAERTAPVLDLGRVLVLSRRVLAAELRDPSGALAALQARIAGALGVDEGRPFRPHVTVARLRPRTRAPRETNLQLAPRTFHGRSVTLYASHLGPKGARYEDLATSGYIQP